jgi:hemolysin activation/secretion protein
MEDHQIALFGIRSDSRSLSSAEGLLVTGKGNILGTRYIIPLDPYQRYAHNITIGLDYKDIEESIGLDGTSSTEMEKKPVTYLPLSFAYSASLPDSWGMTRFSGGLNVAFRGLVTDSEKFSVKRYNARGNYLYFTAGVERDIKLPAGMGLFMKLDGQISDQPLISSEQYSAGGMLNVRGYKESEAAGDDAWHGTIELSGPDIGSLFGLKDKLAFTPYLFYDLAWLSTKDPLPGENEVARLRGTGIGFRGSFYKGAYYEVALAFPLTSTAKTERYEAKWHFKAGFQF